MTSAADIRIISGFDVDDRALSRLHALAFGADEPTLPRQRTLPWRARLAEHSVAHVGAFAGPELVGFVHAAWDGGEHAFLLDTVVHPRCQRLGIGTALVARLRGEVERAGCGWLHVDFEPHLAGFYRACGFASTDAGLIRLGPPDIPGEIATG